MGNIYNKNPNYDELENRDFIVTLCNDSDTILKDDFSASSYSKDEKELYERNNVRTGVILPKTQVSIAIPARVLFKDLKDNVFQADSPEAKYFFYLHKKGLELASDSMKMENNHDRSIEVHPGDSVRIINTTDPNFVPEKQVKAYIDLVIEVLEHNVAYKDLWDNIFKRVDKKTQEKWTTPEKLKEEYIANSTNRIMEWYEFYKPLYIDNYNFNQQSIDKALSLGGKARVDLYWRALGRTPADIMEWHNVNYSIYCSNLTCYHRHYEILEGRCRQSRYGYRPPRLNTKEFKREKLPLLLSALKGLPVNNSECSFLEDEERRSFDSSESDQDWIHQEIIVSMPLEWNKVNYKYFNTKTKKEIFYLFLINNQITDITIKLPFQILNKICNFIIPIKYVDVKRLMKECLMRNDYDNFHYEAYIKERNLNEEGVPPSEEQKKVLECAKEIIGIGDLVNSFSEDFDDTPLGAAGIELKEIRNEQGDDISGGEHCYYHEEAVNTNLPGQMPFYFRYCAATDMENIRDPSPLN